MGKAGGVSPGVGGAQRLIRAGAARLGGEGKVGAGPGRELDSGCADPG